MTHRHAVLSARISQDLTDLQSVVDRVGRAVSAARAQPENQDLFLDSIALNLHDFYSGLERIFQQIATQVDASTSDGHDWHRHLLRQMGVAIPQVRPQVLSPESLRCLDEYLRFRHVVRHIYAFELDADRIDGLVERLPLCFERVLSELTAFADLLTKL